MCRWSDAAGEAVLDGSRKLKEVWVEVLCWWLLYADVLSAYDSSGGHCIDATSDVMM
jgi:hypothetical protein